MSAHICCDREICQEIARDFRFIRGVIGAEDVVTDAQLGDDLGDDSQTRGASVGRAHKPPASDGDANRATAPDFFKRQARWRLFRICGTFS